MIVARALVALNVLVWVLNVVGGVDPLSPSPRELFGWGASHALANAEQPWRLLVSTFLHAGFIHLAVNMQALWIAGPIVESFYGRFPFLALYLCSGVAGALASMVGAHPGGVVVGASGAIFGTMGGIAAAVWRHGHRLHPDLVAALKRLLWSFVAINLVIGLILPNVSNASHVGGLVAGFLFALPLTAPGARRRDEALRAALATLAATVLIVIAWQALTAPYAAALPGGQPGA